MATISEEENYSRLEIYNNEKIQEYTPAIVYVAVVVVFGICGNILSVIYYGFRCSRTPTNVIITALGIVDLLCCVILADEIIELCYTVTFQNVAGCKVMYFVNHCLVFVAGTTLFFVGIDRYRKICRPFKWQFTIFRIRLAFFAIVGYSIAVSVRDLVILDVVRVNVTMAAYDEPISAFYCTHSDKGELQGVITVFQVIDLITFIVVVGGSGVLYTLIAVKLWKIRRRAHHVGQEETSTELTTVSNIDETAYGEKFETDNTTEKGIEASRTTASERRKPAVVKLDKIIEQDTALPDEEESANPETGHDNVKANYGNSRGQNNDTNTDNNIDQVNGKDDGKGGELDESNDSTETETDQKELSNTADDNCNIVDKGSDKDKENIDTSTDNSTKERKDKTEHSENTTVAAGVEEPPSPSKRKLFEARLTTIKKKVISKASGLTAEMKVEQKVTVMMLVITSVSIVSFVPYFVVNLGIKSNSETSDQEFSVGIQIALRSYILNNAVNPYIIGMFNSQFRQFVKDLILRRTCRRPVSS